MYFEAPGEPSLYARVVEIRDKSAVLKTLRDFTHLKNAVWGVTSRNREQNFALNILMDPEIDFVTLAGTAGTGKTRMALAAGLTQVLDDRRYTEIIMTRATVSVGEAVSYTHLDVYKRQTVFGVSRDNMRSNDEFKAKLELPFELIADTEEKMCHMFGVVKNKIMYGKKGKGIERSTFLVGADGTLKQESVSYTHLRPSM